jgi:hypothetical protein
LLDEVLAYSDHSPLADEYKRTWKKPGFFLVLSFKYFFALKKNSKRRSMLSGPPKLK